MGNASVSVTHIKAEAVLRHAHVPVFRLCQRPLPALWAVFVGLANLVGTVHALVDKLGWLCKQRISNAVRRVA